MAHFRIFYILVHSGGECEKWWLFLLQNVLIEWFKNYRTKNNRVDWYIFLSIYPLKCSKMKARCSTLISTVSSFVSDDVYAFYYLSSDPSNTSTPHCVKYIKLEIIFRPYDLQIIFHACHSITYLAHFYTMTNWLRKVSFFFLTFDIKDMMRVRAQIDPKKC